MINLVIDTGHESTNISFISFLIALAVSFSSLLVSAITNATSLSVEIDTRINHSIDQLIRTNGHWCVLGLSRCVCVYW